MVSPMVTPLVWILLQQQIDETELNRAIQQDAAPVASPEAPTVVPPVTSALAARDALAAQPGPGVLESGTQPNGRRPGSSLMNPAMSVILDGTFGFYGRHRADFDAALLPVAGDDPSPGSEGFSMQEIELAFQSAIDPYLEGALFLTIPNLEGVEVEEGYLITTSLPLNLQVKAGTFRSQVGRNNTQHLHLQSFTRRPLFTSLLFGADGLRGPGAQASVLLPWPWFATLYLEAFSLGAPEDPTAVASFGGGARQDPSNMTYTAVLEQYWDATDTASFLLGLNAATGRLFDCAGMDPCPAGGARTPRTWLYGADLTYHWRPANVAQTYASSQWTTEFFLRTITAGGQTEGSGYTEPVVQFARRWFVGGRFDLVGLPAGAVLARRYGTAASLTFTPSEFSRFRLYVQEISGPGIPSSTVAFFQTEVSLGAHGAHPF